ncbi:MAG TPA: UDP-galactopyranose mutase [Casimicrobiaceae bacterium]|nr:UDP-galactopyranose mutase [Casimicrobiaceae bacterium]
MNVTTGSLPALDVLVVGMGLAGLTAARTLADTGFRVHLVDRRNHVGGNAFDTIDAHGILIHPYGPHIFHTNAERIVEFLSRFTGWRRYEHRVLAKVGDQMLPLPINRTTINRLYGLDLDEQGVRDFLARVRQPRDRLVTSEDAVLASVGSDLCEKFFRGYTRKQWGLDLSELSAGVVARIPVRTNDDDGYFSDKYQLMPDQGYTAMFLRMLDHPLISYETAVDFAQIRDRARYRWLVYTGRIDAYFDYCYGRLPYRSLEFHHKHLPSVERFQPVGTVNFPNDFEFTRITEFKHLTGQPHAGTSIVREFPRANGEPFYPVPRPENEALFKKYEARAAECERVTFVGRLAQYRYYNMDQVVGAALAATGRLMPLLAGRQPLD